MKNRKSGISRVYIDPPYNTGARDWKYNNDYVDKNDAWRHSKWLSFMEKRLQLARRLLNPSAAVLIITIDEKEYTHLGLLLEDVFKGCKLQMVSTLINPAGVAREGGFARSDEYIFFVTLGDSAPQRLRLKRDWVSAKGRTHTGSIRWDLLRRSGTNTTRSHSPGCFFPIYVDPNVPKVELVGDALPAGVSLPEPKNDLVPVLPIRKDGSEGVWQWSAMTFRERLLQGRVRITGSRERGFVISILKDGEYAKIQRGEFQEIGRGPDGAIIVDSIDTGFVRAVPASQWRISSHDATQYGSRFLAEIIPDLKFPFPKSIYAVHDCIRFFVADRPNAIILDFFCGSGTTLNAVNLLNASDGGQRRCILVTNNEVSGDEAEAMRARGLQPGDETWEAQGICRSVTWPRSKFTIRGQRDDGTPLPGDYLTGGTVERERPRRIVHIGFVDPAALNTAARKKQLVALLPSLPQTLATEDSAFIVSEDHASSVLFDETAAADWLDALDGQEQITDLYVVATTKKVFNQIKAQVQNLLGPLRITEEEKRPLAEGFAANLAYFRLDFLDQDRVALKRAFREILPLLWLKAGAIGPRPELPAEAPDPDFFAPPENPFAVLLDEGAMQPLLQALDRRTNLRLLFIVTDAEEAFQELSAEARARLAGSSPQLETVQLYRDYLENFLVNIDPTQAAQREAGV